MSAFNRRQYPGLQAAGAPSDAELIELFFDVLGRFEFFFTYFRVLVKNQQKEWLYQY